MSSRSKASLGLATLASVLALLALCTSAASAASFDCSVPLDNFNRANSTGLGSNWTVRTAEMNVSLNSATNPNSTEGLATWNSAVPTEQACVDVSQNGNTLQYAAIALGYANEENTAFVKVQTNSSNGFDTAFIYYGNNGACQITGGCSFPITPFHSGRLHAVLVPSTGEITLEIDTNFDNVADQVITKKYNAPFSFGNAIGLGSYGGAYLDNFATAAAPTPTPTPTPTPVPTPPAAPNTKITKAKIKSSAGSAMFKFSGTGSVSKYQCALAKKGKKLTYKGCKSPKTYSGLTPGKYTFKVRAVGPGGTDSSPATKKFSI
jgi:hypothetical protein